MSCDTNTHKVTVLGNLDVDHDYRGRHGRDDEDRRVGLKDLIQAARDGEAHRDIVREVLEAKFATVRETVESKAEILRAVAEVGEKVSEAKHDLAVKILEADRERLRDLLMTKRDRCGGHD